MARESRPRREWGTGSLHPHGESWRVTIALGTDPQGKRLRREWQFSSKKAAERKLKDINERRGRGLPPEESRVTVAAYAQDWLSAVKIARKANATYEQYESLTRNHVVHAFGYLPLARVTPSDLRRLIASMTDEGYASRTIRGVLDCFRMLSRQAMHDGILTRNVAELVQKPKLEQAEPRHFTAEQARRFLEVAKDDALGSLFSVALGTGLRRGELLALSWRDVAPSLDAVTVRKSKTAAGIRVVPLPAFAGEALGAMERRPGPIWTVSKWWVSHKMGQLCERAGLPRLGLHGLRHTAATLLLAEGVDPFTIQSILGHSRVSMTGHYARAEDAGRRDAVERLDKAIGGTG